MMELPRNNADYGKSEYWNQRYSREEQYDWLGVYDHFSSALENILDRHHGSDSILHLGCGNSSLSSDLQNAGWWNVTNIDISSVVLHNMRSLDRLAHQQTYLAMDMTNMPFRDHCFDIVIEKATLDSLLVTSKSPWDLDTRECQLVKKSLGEIKRVLQRGGTFVSITFAQPHFRVPLLASQQLAWDVQVQKIKGQGLDCYVMAMRDGDPGPALRQYSVPYKLALVENESWESSDEERFLDNLNLSSSSDSDPDDESWTQSA